MKNKIKAIILTLCIVGAAIGGIIGIGAGIFYLGKDRADPLYYCLNEIKNQEYKFCAFDFFYEKLGTKSELQEDDPSGDSYSYYITTFGGDKKIEWYCFVKFKSNSSLFKGYKPEELVLIDCDIMFETQYA